MKNPFSARPPPFDAQAINETIQRALASAGLDTTSGPMHSVTETIRRAMASGGEPIRKPSIGDAQAPGAFETHEFSNHAGTRSYKLYVPTRSPELPPPMVVMLHGCTQSADDFAAGTQMNRLADEHGFLVVYPEQAAHANPSKCWNWFNAQDQVRGAGEPALIAGIVRDVAARHGADPRRIFVAGLSAGASMAVILGETYPELFAGVGAHSGLPYGCARDIPSAMTAMKGGRSGLAGSKCMPGATVAPRKPHKRAVQAVPIIVFHGDRDHTVQQTNAAEIVQQARDARVAEAGNVDLVSSTQRGTAPGGRAYSRTLHADAGGAAHIESWTLHGAGHAWSGGNASGSYTDGSGPNASAEMVRFFLALPRASTTRL
jgi:poly(hydroxyalkanoate) depolymerase family esterase